MTATLAPKRVAVVGGGIMGGGIAALFANQGIPVTIFEINEELARKSLERLADTKQKIQQLTSPRNLKQISVALVDEYAEKLADHDVIVEVVPEILSLKKKVLAAIDQHRAPGSIVSTNTSGISIESMSEDLSDDFRQHFLGTHYFHPVRYMPLVELIPGSMTKREVMERYADFYLGCGKEAVTGRDTPNFIANRIGVYAMNKVLALTEKYRLPIELVDVLTGPPLANPKSASFRLADMVGLDTLFHVLNNSYENCPDDEVREELKPHAWIAKLVEAKRYGQKTGEGFYKKVGKGQIHVIDMETMEYRPQDKRPRADRIRVAKGYSDVRDRVKALVTGPQDDPVSSFARELTLGQGAYALNRVGEVADDVATIDAAMRLGFGRELGPIECLDAIGLERCATLMEDCRIPVPALLKTALEGKGSFYGETPEGHRTFFVPATRSYQEIERDPRHLSLKSLKRQGKVVRENLNARLIDLGDGVLLCELDVKMVPAMNPVDDFILSMMGQAHEEIASGRFQALVIGNQAQHFCAGANLKAVLELAKAKRFDLIEKMAKSLQDLNLANLYAEFPVVTAPHGMALGGGLEIALGGQVRVATSELYCGLVEVGVGLVPAGGGCLRLLQLQSLKRNLRGGKLGPMQRSLAVFDLVAFAKVSTSADDARAKRLIAKDDIIVFSKAEQLQRAKEVALERAANFTQIEREPLQLPGQGGFLVMLDTINTMQASGAVSEHAARIARAQAKILSGGEGVSPVDAVDPQHVLDLEREAFLELAGHPMTQARMAHMLKTGKPLFN
ncbi:MAG: enoyl-CoA hydratase/isomerase family protein [Planctomycetes bacterium]|nr:enoyl-CoA hydratase/isomerase family protein [Planctomycetota bacterium]